MIPFPTQFPMPGLKYTCTDDRGVNTDNNSGIDITGLSIGPVVDDRYIVFGVALRANVNVSSVTLTTCLFNGVEAAVLGRRTAEVGNTAFDMAYYGAYIPAGTSMSVRQNWTGRNSNLGCVVYAFTGLYKGVRRFDVGVYEQGAFSVPVADDRVILFASQRQGGTYPDVTVLTSDATNQQDIGQPDADGASRRFSSKIFSGVTAAAWAITNPNSSTALSISLR